MKNQSYQNMSIKNVFLNENRICKDPADLDKKNDFEIRNLLFLLVPLINFGDRYETS